MRPGWYILLYHDVSWADPLHVRHVSLTCPPDVFRDHVDTCANMGRVVGVQEAMETLVRGPPREPLISFWFDDGLRGVREYAAPILAAHGAAGAISACSRFACRTEMFWRFKLSYLHAIGADAAVRDCLAAHGCEHADQLRSFTIERFDERIVAALDEAYVRMVPAHEREDGFRVFDTPEGLLDLSRRGWVIANHSAAHYPIGESRTMDLMLAQFEECEAFIRDLTGASSGYWVFPFDRKLEPGAVDLLRDVHPEQVVVLVRNGVNRTEDAGRRVLRRIGAPPTSRNGLRARLIEASAG